MKIIERCRKKLASGESLSEQDIESIMFAAEHYQTMARYLTLEHANLLSRMPSDVRASVRRNQISVCENAIRSLSGERIIFPKDLPVEREIVTRSERACHQARQILQTQAVKEQKPGDSDPK